MTAKIFKSAIDAFPNFDLSVAEHADKLRHWRAHMAKVEAEKGNDKIAPIDRHQPYERPRAHQLIEAAIDDKFNVAYEVVDDSAATLTAKKQMLIARVAQAEGEAMAAVLAPGKSRLYAMREARIQEEDAQRSALLVEQQKPGLIKRLTGGGSEFDIAAAVAEQRPSADTQFLQELQELRRRMKAIGLIAAQAMSDIEDLTLDTIEQWKMPDFSGV